MRGTVFEDNGADPDAVTVLEDPFANQALAVDEGAVGAVAVTQQAPSLLQEDHGVMLRAELIVESQPISRDKRFVVETVLKRLGQTAVEIVEPGV